jgi:hypothetical protein
MADGHGVRFHRRRGPAHGHRGGGRMGHADGTSRNVKAEAKGSVGRGAFPPCANRCPSCFNHVVEQGQARQNGLLASAIALAGLTPMSRSW